MLAGVAQTIELLAAARVRAGLSQRDLASRSGVPQASISRIEQGRMSPRATTVERWLAACGMVLEIRPLEGSIDQTLIRERLAMSPLERHRLAVAEARALLSLKRGRLVRSAGA
jgi:transcriptional regulator with XRE-family HTH domain